jgi:hypothetical protein
VTAIRITQSDNEIRRCFPVMAELRTHPVADEFVGRVRRYDRLGYRLAFLQDAGALKAVARFRIGKFLCRGKILYVDDWVTTGSECSRCRSRQILGCLLNHTPAEGREQIHLDSGVEKFAAHRFCLRSRMHVSSHQFSFRL